MYRLVFLSGRMKGRRVAVQQGSIMIGRDPQCHIDIAYDDEVSRNHAIIEQRPDGVWLKDLGSMNKTEVNGKPATEVKLHHGDKLEIGRTQIEFQNIEVVKTGSRRSVNKAQVLAFFAIAAVILVQIAFVFVLPMWQNTDLGGPKHGKAPKNVVAAVAPAHVPAATTPTPTPTPAPAENVAPVAAVETNPAATETVDQILADVHNQTNAPAAVTESSIASSDQVTAEVQQLRQALAELQKQVADLNPPGAAPTNAVAAPQPSPAATSAVVAAATTRTGAAPVAVETNAAASAPSSDNDALQEKAKAMLAQAKAEIGKNNLTGADDLLERVQVLAPDFTPAYVERANLYESRGMLKKAGEQWSKAMDLSMGTPLYEEAAAERQRLARTELIQTMTSDHDIDKDNAERLPRRIRIVNVEREKFEANQEFDEMRLVRINVKPRMSEGEIDTAEFVCTVVFYDRSQPKDVVQPTRAVAPKDALKVDGKWPAGEQKTLTAAYIVPKNFRAEEEKTIQEKRVYEGYRVLIYYKGVLQDEAALPKNLLSLPAPPPPDRTGK